MSKLYCSVDSDSQKTTTKGGHKEMNVHIRGWDIGIEVSASILPNGKIKFAVFQTEGSNNPRATKLLDEVWES
jgi:hypothetical protein